MIIYISRK